MHFCFGFDTHDFFSQSVKLHPVENPDKSLVPGLQFVIFLKQ